MMEYLMAAPVASAIFAITLATSIWAFYSDNIYENMILNAQEVAHGRRVYTLITSGFIHADIMHLLFNLLSYYFFAFTLEAGIPQVGFQGLGHWQFGLLYFVSLILSDLPTVYKHRNDGWYNCLGASGAVSAVIFSFILFLPMGRMGMMLIPGIDLPAFVFGILYLIYCNYASRKGVGNINHDAHFFGALSGLLITVILNPHVVHSFIEQTTAGVQSWFH